MEEVEESKDLFFENTHRLEQRIRLSEAYFSSNSFIVLSGISVVISPKSLTIVNGPVGSVCLFMISAQKYCLSNKNRVNHFSYVLCLENWTCIRAP